MRKIAIVIPKFGLVGGAEQFASELSEKLSSGHQETFHVFANRWQSNSHVLKFHKIPIISFPKFLTTISFAWFVQRQIQRNNFSLVHSHERIFAADIFTLHGVPHRYWVDQVRRKRMSLYDTATAWVEKKLVYEGQVTTFDEAIASGLPIKEAGLIDALIPGLEDEVLDINMVQRMTDSGRPANAAT